MVPIYIQQLLQPYIPSRSLRPNKQNLVVVRKTLLKTKGDMAFAVEKKAHSESTILRLKRKSLKFSSIQSANCSLRFI